MTPLRAVRYQRKTNNMEKQIKKPTKKQIKRIILTLILGVLLIAACVFLYRLLNFGFTIGIISVAVFLVILAIVGIFKSDTVFKLMMTFIYVGLIVVVAVVILDYSGFINRFDSTEAFVNYINNSNGMAEVLFLLVQFLQVTFIPIPSTITTVGATLLFPKFWKAFALANAGLIIGSMFAFFLGRVFGVKLAKWLVGEEAMEKYQRFMKGRDKIILFYMFLFPFFPDDFLCLLAGLTNMSYFGFFIMMLITRSIGTASTIFMAKGIFKIPFEGWGIPVWIALVLLVLVLFVVTIKYSAKIEAMMLKLIDKITFKKKNVKEDAEQVDTLSNQSANSASIEKNVNVENDEIKEQNGSS